MGQEGTGKSRGSAAPKSTGYKRVRVSLRPDQVEHLEDLASEIMCNRVSKGKRVTRNTILRAYIDVLKDVEYSRVNIANESYLYRRIRDQVVKGARIWLGKIGK